MKYFNTSISKFLSVSVFLISTNVFALSEQAQEGKELYLDANCVQCHGNDGSFDIKNHKAKDIAGLASWVRACDATLETGWFPEEQSSVIKYLNESYYKYNKN